MSKLFHVDAFTYEKFTGNPAGVCLLDGPMKDAAMQTLTKEVGYSDTAFVIKEGDLFNLRWFTPAVEVDLCGHATLATAHILWEEGVLKETDEARFSTRSGTLRAQKGVGGWIEMDFPAEVAEPAEAPAGLIESLGVTPCSISKNRFDYLVEVATEDEVRGVCPDLAALAEIETRGVIVTAPSESPEFDFVSRFFAPRLGIDEDPVTGSAHAALGPYWAKKFEKQEVTGFQASERGGVVRVRPGGDRVVLAGMARTIKGSEAAL